MLQKNQKKPNHLVVSLWVPLGKENEKRLSAYGRLFCFPPHPLFVILKVFRLFAPPGLWGVQGVWRGLPQEAITVHKHRDHPGGAARQWDGFRLINQRQERRRPEKVE